VISTATLQQKSLTRKPPPMFQARSKTPYRKQEHGSKRVKLRPTIAALKFKVAEKVTSVLYGDEIKTISQVAGRENRYR
jgi:hypothetical protein